MPYPSCERKKPDIFQAFEEGDKHAPGATRVEEARKRKKDRARKSGKENNVVEVGGGATMTKTKKPIKKGKAKKKVDKLVVKLKLRKDKLEEKKKKAEEKKV